MRWTTLSLLVALVCSSAKADPLFMEDLMPVAPKPKPRRLASLETKADEPSHVVSNEEKAATPSPWGLDVAFRAGPVSGLGTMTYGGRIELRYGLWQLEVDGEGNESSGSERMSRFDSSGSAETMDAYTHRSLASLNVTTVLRPEVSLGRGMRLVPRLGVGAETFRYEKARDVSYFGKGTPDTSEQWKAYSEAATGYGPTAMAGVELLPSSAFAFYSDLTWMFTGGGHGSTTLYQLGDKRASGLRARIGVTFQVSDHVHLGLEKSSRFAEYAGIRTGEDSATAALHLRW